MRLLRPSIHLVLALALGLQTGIASDSASKPNILLILADDLGWSDLGCYGGEIKTPNLDALAKDGLRFSQAYNSSRCCPSRASLLTGLYPHQAGIGRFVGRDNGMPGYRGSLNDNTVTLAEVLKKAGYSTSMVGKWHVNEPGPTERGFDEFYGFIHGHGLDSWEPRMMIRLPEGRPQRQYAPGEYFATDAITDHALEFIDDARKRKQPWFAYVAYQAPHFPVQAPPDLTDAYVPTYEKGWDVLRADRIERLKTLGLVPASMQDPGRSPIENIVLARKAGSATKDGKIPPGIR
jgi:arylsulfatase A-like enzyme